MTTTLDLPANCLVQVQNLLRQYVPEAEVWAYGSRVTGGAHESSDLDLVLRCPKNLAHQQVVLSELKQAFSESSLPISIDVMDWARIPLASQKKITQGYVVIQDVFSKT